MYYQSGEFRGPVYAQRLTKKPTFKYHRDCGRLITVENDNSYIGGNHDWLPISLDKVLIHSYNLKTGYDTNEINAGHIPTKLPNGKIQSVEQCLNDRIEIESLIKQGKYFDKSAIQPESLNLNPLKGGLTAKDIIYADEFHKLGPIQNTNTISDALNYLLTIDGTKIPLGEGIVFRDKYVMPNDMSITAALDYIVDIADQNLHAENVTCEYYEPDPTGKTHCVQSNVQEALESVYNTLYTHRLIDHLDVQHDWGRCGQYLGTCGHPGDDTEDCDCCLNNAHLPLKFKQIKACEIRTTVNQYLCLPDADPEMDLQSLLYIILNMICCTWPIGSIFITVSHRNPRELIGYGCWTRIEGKFLLGWSETKFNVVEELGGEEEHTLTIDEMPSHTHVIPPSGEHYHQLGCGGGDGNGVHHGYSTSTLFTTNVSGNHSHIVNNTGGNRPHNNMPPYMVVYMWKRVA